MGSPDYLAPEVLLKSAYGPMVDWWAAGVMLFELLVGITPFDGDTPDQIYANILNRRIRWPNIPADMSPVAKDLIGKFLTLSTADRLGAHGVSEIQAHPFFEGIDWEHLAVATAPFLPPSDDPTSTKYFDGRNEVFQSPLEVNLTGDRLQDITLVGMIGTRPITAQSVFESSYTPEDAVMHPRRDDGTTRYLSKAFWNLEGSNRRALAEYEQQTEAAAAGTTAGPGLSSSMKGL
jgi:serine/threonine protein kinase